MNIRKNAKLTLTGLSVLLTVLFAVPVFAGTEISKENFPDDAFREIVSKFDTNGDGFLIPDECEAVEEINCDQNQALKSVEGIQFFPNLTTLLCYKCPVTKLDLSSNTKLEQLLVEETGLTALDISHNPNLKIVNAYGNAFTELDLSSNKQLSNAVKQGPVFDKNNGESYAFSYDSETYFLVVDKKVKMYLADKTTVGPAEGYSSSSAGTDQGSSSSSTPSQTESAPDIVTAINSAAFPDSNFLNFVRTFDTDNDSRLSRGEIAAVSSIDCSNRNISSLKGIGFFTETISLDCSSNRLTALDLRSNTKLRHLHCNGNSLTALDVSHNTALNSLYIYANRITEINVSNSSNLCKAALKGRNEETDYDYFKDPHYTTVTIYLHGVPSNRSIDNSYYLYVDKTVKVIAGDVTIDPSVAVPGSSSSGSPSSGSSSSASSGSGSSSSGSSSSGSSGAGSSSSGEKSGDSASGKNGGSKSSDSASGSQGSKETTASKDTKAKTKLTIGALTYRIRNNKATVIAPKSKSAAKITIPASIKVNKKSVPVTEIAASAFKNLKKLKTVTIGKNIKTIGKNAFNGCKKLQKITISTSKLTAKTVGANAFKGIQAKAVIKCPKAKKTVYKKLLLKKGVKKTAAFK